MERVVDAGDAGGRIIVVHLVAGLLVDECLEELDILGIELSVGVGVGEAVLLGIICDLSIEDVLQEVDILLVEIVITIGVSEDGEPYLVVEGEADGYRVARLVFFVFIVVVSAEHRDRCCDDYDDYDCSDDCCDFLVHRNHTDWMNHPVLVGLPNLYNNLTFKLLEQLPVYEFGNK